MDGHSSVFSTPALRALGLEGKAVDGVLTGEAHEFNMGRVNDRLMKAADAGTIARGLHEAVAEAAACRHVTAPQLHRTLEAAGLVTSEMHF